MEEVFGRLACKNKTGELEAQGKRSSYNITVWKSELATLVLLMLPCTSKPRGVGLGLVKTLVKSL